MRTIAVALTVGMAMTLPACVTRLPQPINSLAFEKRPPLPGQPGYLETIKYIYDGMHYVAPTAGFLVSNIGDLCFQDVLEWSYPPEAIPNNFWCINPLNISRVEAIENDISYINQIRLWCRLKAAQCAYKVGYPNLLDNLLVANSITVETVPFLRQRDAVEYLVYLMGGNAQRDLASQ
jgi:hypothetical protein